MAKIRFLIAKDDIIDLFEGLPSKVLKRSNLSHILDENRGFWRLPVSMTVKRFADLMVQHTKLRQVVLIFPSRRQVRYTWGDLSPYEVASSLGDRAYFTHFSAMRHHDLTDQIPTTLYLNVEQPPKPFLSRKLTQERIDWAFRRKPRISKTVARYREYNICLLNGMFTNQLGVTEAQTPEGTLIRVTNPERTLLDIAVRPFYAGGVFQIVEAYRRATDIVSVNKLVATLKSLNYISPYHQAVGFYQESARTYRKSQVGLLENMPQQFDFYLAHGMKETDYSRKWRLYYPAGL